MPMTTQGDPSHIPVIAGSFAITFDKEVPGLIISCDGLESKSEVTEARSGGKEGRERKPSRVPGKLSFTPLTIKMFVLKGERYFEDWFQKIHDHGDLKAALRNGSIRMFDWNYQEVAAWEINNAWPSKLAYSDLDSDSNEAMSLTVTLVYENFKRTK